MCKLRLLGTVPQEIQRESRRPIPRVTMPAMTGLFLVVVLLAVAAPLARTRDSNFPSSSSVGN